MANVGGGEMIIIIVDIESLRVIENRTVEAVEK